MLLYVKGGSIVQPNTFSPDFDMEAISVSDDLLQLLFNGRVPLSNNCNRSSLTGENVLGWTIEPPLRRETL